MMRNDRLRVLVTGATGFVGGHLCRYLLARGYRVRAVGRKKQLTFKHPLLEYHCLPAVNDQADWQHLLPGVDVIVHLAGRAHHMNERGMSALPLYQEVNVKGTQQLAQAAVKNEVKRFIYISTIKVIGERTIDTPLRAEEQPRPQDPYSLSKLQGEQILQEESRRSGMEWVIIRPPLVYGPGVKGNFRRLVSLAKTHFPIPFGAIRNRRSLVSVYNLSSFIECCLAHPNARNETFLVSDGEDLSTGQLVKLLRRAQGRRSWVFPFPTSLLKFFAFLLGKRQAMERLIDSLQVNIEKSTRLLGWYPPYSIDGSLKTLFAGEEEKEEGVELVDEDLVNYMVPMPVKAIRTAG